MKTAMIMMTCGMIPSSRSRPGDIPRGHELASQPTLSQFENSVTSAMLQRLPDFNITTGIERLQRHHGDVPDEIILDIDPTDDATHGRQQLSLFHGFYKLHQYSPQIISEPVTKHVFSQRGRDRGPLIRRSRILSRAVLKVPVTAGC
jgi:hypothetical protein